ncbi:AAA domain-containing protein [Enterobacillus tribolii]|uniref:Uncharacterized protein DUF4011 n=1 Tax=Enterobacillus tribolii TaxID=1487935 RepID=A0A370R4M7_9GAMM|nr:AAA domain-containing protein [Enterobacillus tribolii]MBW7983326.1 DUF4011 domain-containing protein [Enterobacillus tribolii]RDK97383.1 uncharacterized protein DUF4011 [Enterobacillus tribolii]
MMRFCPNCHTERALTEIFCEGRVDDRPCGWDLSAEPIHAKGWRPEAVVAASDVAPPESAAGTARLCRNGHPLDDDDLMCLVCGADAPAEVPVPEAGGDEVTAIDGWQLLRRINRDDSVRERYLAQHQEDGRQAVLTLYACGAEPDPAIYDVVRRLPREHVPEIIATGRWNERAWQVAEALTGGSLEAFVAGGDYWHEDEIPHVVRELGSALFSFAEHGLRHRDLRPGNLLIRTRHPLDIVIIEFGSACLSEFDLDIVAPLGISRYSAPETLAGGVAAASDWWNLGIILLEQLTHGACFDDVHPHAFLIQVLANGVTLPDNLDPRLRLLLRGLLTRDRHRRWQWPEVEAWLEGRPVAVADEMGAVAGSGAEITLGGSIYRQPAAFALAAATQQHWQEAQTLLLRGEITTWAQTCGVEDTVIAMLRQVSGLTETDDDFRLMLALKQLNPNMPLILRGEIVTPAWLLEHPQEGYALLTGPLPEMLGQGEPGHWLTQLNARQARVRERGTTLGIAFDEETLRIHLLATSRVRLAALWEEQRRLFPDTRHPGLKTLIDRRNLSEDDLIVLLSAGAEQYVSAESLLTQAQTLAARCGVLAFEREAAREWLQAPRQTLYQQLADRINGFNRSDIPDVDAWAGHFLLTRRLPLEQVLVMLAVPAEQWLAPERRRYVSQVLSFFTRKITASSMRGSLVRMRITPHAARVDLCELGGGGKSAAALLNHLLARGKTAVSVDGEALLANESANGRLRTLCAQTLLYQRDTGIDGRYLGFPFLLLHNQPRQMKPRIAPLLLWPVSINMEAGIRDVASLRFDHERGVVRLNPALENFVGIPAVKAWQSALDELLGQSSLTAEEVMESLSALLPAREKQLVRLTQTDEEIEENSAQLVCSAVLFHASFIGQAISEDLRQLSALSPGGTALETALGLGSPQETPPRPAAAHECYFAVTSDPSQEAAILAARNAPGLLIEGPPGTGKSQTIVNMVADAIGRRSSLLVICQKPAALEVVFKRIVACGLGDRVVMVKDVLRERDAIIRNVRTQLEGLYRPAETAVNPWVTSRRDTAEELEQTGKVLDEYYQALYRTDANTGISYRALLGELMVLESDPRRLDVPALRSLLQPCALEQVETIKRAIGPWIPLWLNAEYEQSPLAQLTPFPGEPVVLDDFRHRFIALRERERIRDETLAGPYQAIDISAADCSGHQHTLERYPALFGELTDAEWENLSRWLPLFFSYHGSLVQGGQILQQLDQLAGRLQEIDGAGADPLLFLGLAACDGGLLPRLITATEDALRRSFWRYLNPFYYVRRGKLNAFLQQQGLQETPDLLARLGGSARLELQWRLVRTELSRLHQHLGLPPAGLLDALALGALLTETRRNLRRTAQLFEPLTQSPDCAGWVSAIVERQRDGFERHTDELKAAIRRCQARSASLDALAKLRGWLEASVHERFTQAITTNRRLTQDINALEGALPALASYQQFRPLAAQLDESSLAVLKYLREQESALKAFPVAEQTEVVSRTLDREVRLSWKQQMERQTPLLLLDAERREEQVARLDGADRRMREWNKLALTTDLDRERISPLRAWEEITRLRGKRARRLREFIEEGEALGLMHLRPVWLMTPDVASQVLPLKAGLFDAVIYDEASQMPVEFALPTLFRSRRMVVSGDEKQMPPSAFFSGRFSADDEDEEETDAEEGQQDEAAERWDYRRISDCPDLLHLARTVLPVQTLEIHYRSAYRELIEFSNHAFYENRLNIPVQHSEKVIGKLRPVSLIEVNGRYQNQTNLREAFKVVKLLAAIWKLPYDQRPSVGVVTFNQKQAQLIERKIEARAERDSVFRQAYWEEQKRSEDDEDMSFFVKNVENVQGDERDVIIFSTTFGRNKQGTFRRNFGVLGQSGGERRLNVAVTRARRQVHIVSSMPVQEISDLLSTRRKPDIPRDYLQGYLEYARHLSQQAYPRSRELLGRMMRSENVATGATQGEDGFVREVKAFIRELGWQPADSRREGAFYYDCLLEDPHSGEYLIGIECDVPHHPLLAQARARELWRPALLKRVAPYRHRVSVQGWYNDGERERIRLRQAIEQAMKTRAEVHPPAYENSEENQ